MLEAIISGLNFPSSFKNFLDQTKIGEMSVYFSASPVAASFGGVTCSGMGFKLSIDNFVLGGAITISAKIDVSPTTGARLLRSRTSHIACHTS